MNKNVPHYRKHLTTTEGEVIEVKPKRSYRNLESGLQVACVNWFRAEYPNMWRYLWSTPNEAKRTKATRNRMLAQGLLSGVPDLFLCIPNGLYPGVHFELKYGDNDLSDNQRIQTGLLNFCGYPVVKITLLSEFSDYVRSHFASIPKARFLDYAKLHKKLEDELNQKKAYQLINKINKRNGKEKRIGRESN